MMSYDYFDSPMGTLEIKATSKGVQHVIFCGDEKHVTCASYITKQCVLQLEEYFNEARSIFDLPLDIVGTSFQQSVWKALTKIPFGQTCTYSQLATLLNNPNAVRAVGGANSRNPIAIILPCHRVIGASGQLTGYAGGIERKQWLLNHEKVKGFARPDTLENIRNQRQAKTHFLT